MPLYWLAYRDGDAVAIIIRSDARHQVDQHPASVDDRARAALRQRALPNTGRGRRPEAHGEVRPTAKGGDDELISDVELMLLIALAA